MKKTLLTIALKQPGAGESHRRMPRRHGTDRNSAMAAIGRLRDAPISNAFC